MNKYKGKKVLVVGFGVSGVAVTQYLLAQGAQVTITDKRQETELLESLKAIENSKVDYQLGAHPTELFLQADCIVVSPGVPLSLPPLVAARERGIFITSEVNMAISAIQEPIIAITGTNGKTTTTLMIGAMLKAEGRNPFVGGNIGNPLIHYVLSQQKADVVVAELSSFQLELIEGLIPQVAIFTNIEEDHLDRYQEMSLYISAKKRLLQFCNKKSTVVLNFDNAHLSLFKTESPSKRIQFFTKKIPTQERPSRVGREMIKSFAGCYHSAHDKTIVYQIPSQKKKDVFDLAPFQLFGEHNRENLMAAICAARSVGVSQQAIQSVIAQFQPIPHRLEFIRKKDGVYFFNDSKGTNVMSMQKSLSAFPSHPIVLIAGGKDKESDFTPLVELVKKQCKILIFLGEAKEKLNRTLGDLSETYLVGTFEEAVLLAYQKSRTGDIVLFSPGCASYDMFKNYEERGDYFKKLVSQL